MLILGVLIAGPSPTHAQNETSRYFQETGHTVSGDFLGYYDSAKDPLLLFGFPITDAFEDPLSGLTVQFFQRARFELHIDADDNQRVQLSPLGVLLYLPGPEVQFPTDTPACRFYSLNNQGHYVCYAFLDFFNANGGLERFGYPLSNIEKQDDLYVQYFERARFEWHPELPTNHRVTLADLGRAYFDQRGYDSDLLTPRVNNAYPLLNGLKVRAFVAKAVIAPLSSQTLFVIVQDQYLRPVAQANVAVTVRYPGGGQDRFHFPLTNAAGISMHDFPVGNLEFDQIVQVAVEVVKGTQQQKAGSWFRIWW
ncbi:MAG TPA: hypothetical protein VMT46_19740 [Anaerolineaceae bacterium]|nr:hypothetical protein [Anaerolineaceae bacterium]